MIIDSQQPTIVDSITCSPAFVFYDLPKPPVQIGESIVLGANIGQTGITLTGNVSSFQPATFPTTSANSGGLVDWTIVDPTHASVTLTSGNPNSSTLVLSGFVFSSPIPANATILGILLEVDQSRVGGSNNDNVVKLRKANAAVGSNLGTLTQWPASVATISYGGNTSLWGTTWLPSDFAAGAGFGVGISETRVSGSPLLIISNVRITVFYTAPNTVKSVLSVAGTADQLP